MTHPIEDRLREAYQAKTARLTEQRLDQLAERRERGLDDLFDGGHTGELPVLGFEEVPASPRHRWIAPGLAAAAVVALAVGATALVANHQDSQPRPNPPASQVTSPSPSSSASASTSVSPPASSTAVAGPAYLPRGKTGSRGEVPWAAVGAGWRLVLPFTDDGSPTALYLYDPVGGRYLINNALPARADLLAWSPDGTRAMLRSGSSDAFRYQEVRLRTGELSSGFAVPLSNFVSYTQPKGLAVLISQTESGTGRLARYDTAGHLKLRYPAELPGLGKLNSSSALYLPDGGQLIIAALTGPMVLMSNDGHLARTYPLPAGYRTCSPVTWWTDTSVLERCQRLTPLSEVDELYLQPVGGGLPVPLTSGGGRYGSGYWNAWPISNGHTLLEDNTGCGAGGYEVLLGDGSTRPLRGPAGLTAGTLIVNVDADLVTFQRQIVPGCGDAGQQHYELVDYDLVTGAVSTLLDGTATMASWPARS